MRILHVVWTLESAAGGPPMVVTRLASAQARLGHEVTILTHAARPGQPETQLPAVPGPNPVHVERVPRSISERIRCRRASRRLKELIPSTDIVHIHGVWAPIGWAAARVASKAETPYCIAPHGMLDPWFFYRTSLVKRLKKRAALALILRAHLNNAAFLHLLNTDEQRLLAALRLKSRGEIIPNAVSFEELDPLPPSDAFHAGRPHLRDRTYILFLSRLHPKKGLDILADAFAAIAATHPSVDLVIAGPDEGAETPLRRQLQHLNLTERAHILGPLHAHDKLAALTGCSCFCLPSRQEGFSMAILEAMACARPVVITDACHFPEVAEVGAGVVVSGEVLVLAAALDALLNDATLARRMGQAGRHLVQERFTWRVAADLSIAAYTRATASRRASAHK